MDSLHPYAGEAGISFLCCVQAVCQKREKAFLVGLEANLGIGRSIDFAGKALVVYLNAHGRHGT